MPQRRARCSSRAAAARITGSKFAQQAIAHGARAVLYEPADDVAGPRSGLQLGDLLRARAGAEPARRHDRRSLLRLAVAGAHGRRHHRHERQDDLRVSARAGAGLLRPARGVRRHASATACPTRSRRPRTPRRMPSACIASSMSCATQGARVRLHGSVLARARSGPREWRALPHGRVHQPHARPSRLPRHDGAVRRRQGAAVRLARARRAHHQCRRRVRRRARGAAVARATHRDHAQASTRAARASSCVPRACSAESSGLVIGIESSWGVGEVTRAAHRRLQRRQRAHACSRRCSRWACRSPTPRRAGAVPRAERPHGSCSAAAARRRSRSSTTRTRPMR